MLPSTMPKIWLFGMVGIELGQSGGCDRMVPCYLLVIRFAEFIGVSGSRANAIALIVSIVLQKIRHWGQQVQILLRAEWYRH